MNTPQTHPLNVGYLVVGLVFLGIAGSWALHTSGAVDTGDARWMVPAVLLLAGTLGLVAFAAKGISRGRQERQAVTADVADEPWTTYDDAENDSDTYSAPTTRIEGDNR
ncbi:MAG: hypothetical protein ABIQ59_04000 [Nocardioidaceae bacterium]